MTIQENMTELVNHYQQTYQNYLRTLAELRNLEQNRLSLYKKIKQQLKNQSTTNLKSADTNTINLLISKPKVVIDEKDTVPSEYISLRPQRLFNIAKIKTDLENGVQIPGVRLENTEKLKIL